MSKNSYPYPPDEFDSVDPKSRPQEVHAARRSTWSRVWPFVVVIIVVPIIAFGVVKVLSAWDNPGSGGGDPQNTPTITDTQTVTDLPAVPPDGADIVDDAADDAVDISDDQSVEEFTVDRTVQVAILNAKGEQGLAARAGELLRQDGWSAVEPGDYEGSEIDGGSAVYYGKNVWSASAESIAGILNIALVEKDTEGSPDGITVILRQDFLL